MTCAIFTMPANHERKLWELFPLHLTIGQHQSHCFLKNKGIFFPPSFFLTLFSLLFLSSQISADHSSHFSPCPGMLWTIVLIPSVLSIKALVILPGTAGRSDSVRSHFWSHRLPLVAGWVSVSPPLADAILGSPGAARQCPNTPNLTVHWSRPGLRLQHCAEWYWWQAAFQRHFLDKW